MTKNFKKIKNELIEKYGSYCQICGEKFNENELYIEHIKAKSKGGTNKKTNLSIACVKCNSKKYNYTSGTYPLTSMLKYKDFYLKLLNYEKKNGTLDIEAALNNLDEIKNKVEKELNYITTLKNRTLEILKEGKNG